MLSVSVGLWIHTYHMRNNYVIYIVTIRLLANLMAALSTGVATMSSLAQLRIQNELN